MKKLIYTLLSFVCTLSLASCGDDAWGNDNEEMAHVYYIGFEDWGTFKNDVKFDVAQGETVAIPMQFYCEFIRPYDVETYYYVAGNLMRGTDYEIVDTNGTVLQPNADGAFVLTWPKAKKGVQNVYVKALNGNTGSFNLQTFDPNSDVTLSNQDVASTIQHTESQYEVRVFTQNFKVTVNVK